MLSQMTRSRDRDHWRNSSKTHTPQKHVLVVVVLIDDVLEHRHLICTVEKVRHGLVGR